MDNSTIRITWDEITKGQWTGLLSMIPNSCHIHTWGYGEAVRKCTNLVPRRGLITLANIPIGLVQTFQRRYLLDTMQETLIIRGPQWIEGKSSTEDRERALEKVKAYFSLKFGQKVTMIDWLKESSDSHQICKALGLEQNDLDPSLKYIDVSKEIEDILGCLGSKWCEHLENELATDTRVKIYDDKDSLDWLLDEYSNSTRGCAIAVPSPDFLHTFINDNSDASFSAHVIIAEPKAAGALLITHGRTATLMFCCKRQSQSELDCSHIILWSAIDKLRSMGVESLDLSGVNLLIADGIHPLNEDASQDKSAKTQKP